jgi:hypothetical protein
MDIDVSVLESPMDASSFLPPRNVTTTTHYVLNTAKTSDIEMKPNDWSVDMFQDGPYHLKSECHSNSLPYIKKLMIDESSHSSSNKPISDQSANLSGLGCFFDFPDAYQSQNEPTSSHRRLNDIVIETTEKENDEMDAIESETDDAM